MNIREGGFNSSRATLKGDEQHQEKDQNEEEDHHEHKREWGGGSNRQEQHQEDMKNTRKKTSTRKKTIANTRGGGPIHLELHQGKEQHQEKLKNPRKRTSIKNIHGEDQEHHEKERNNIGRGPLQTPLKHQEVSIHLGGQLRS